MTTKSIPALFMRGGTSNGLVIHRHHLPENVEDWQPVLSSAMGAPDPYGRELNGMGQGISSTSKVCVIAKSERPDADVDYTFVQVAIPDGKLHMGGNCGNMSSAVGVFAYDQGLLDARGKEGEVKVRIFNTNTSKLIEANFNVTKEGKYDSSGDYSIDGVPGTGSRITLSFLDPAGAKTGKALPTGNPIDTIELPDGTTVRASILDIANPGISVLAEDLGIPGDIRPTELEGKPDVLARLEQIRQAGAKYLNLEAGNPSIPVINFVSRPTDEQAKDGVHLVARAMSMQQPHKAIPLTLALNLGTAARLPGTLPNITARNAEGKESLTLAHASGKIEVGSVVENGEIKSALLHRTARILMKGDVYYTVRP